MTTLQRDGLREHPYGDAQLEILESALAAIDPETRIAEQLAVESNVLAAVNSITGSLDKISKLVHVRASVISDPDFHEQPAMANGASDLLVDLFGEKERHTCAALGTSSLPGNIPVEIELLVRVDPLS